MWEPYGRLSVSLLLTKHSLGSSLARQWAKERRRKRTLLTDLLVMCKGKNPSIGGSRGIESPSNEIDASHWSIHLIECSTSSFLICLIGVMVLLYLFRKYQVCCFKSGGGPVVVEDRMLSRAMPLQELGPGPAQNGGGFRPI